MLLQWALAKHAHSAAALLLLLPCACVLHPAGIACKSNLHWLQ
jgi:hypothetical protein